MSRVEHVLSAGCELGEGPLWHPQENALYWTDILGRKIHRYQPSSGQHTTFPTGEGVGSFAFRKGGGFLLAAGSGLSLWQPGQDPAYTFISLPEINPTGRFNDGKVDPAGRFWAGTVDMTNPGISCLYRLDPRGSLSVMETGLTISNGLGWSPDRTTMYFTDTPTRTIYAYDFDLPSGEISNRRTFVQVPEEFGLPDGLTVDEDGCIWSAMWGGWQVVRYTPAGKIDLRLQLPTECPSSCTFGGENLDVLYITTAWEGMSEEQRSGQPQAGDLFMYKAGVRGLPVEFFAG
jgi:sugar lactone lactonase YvrE